MVAEPVAPAAGVNDFAPLVPFFTSTRFSAKQAATRTFLGVWQMRLLIA
jgi:hypothetical protein